MLVVVGGLTVCPGSQHRERVSLVFAVVLRVGVAQLASPAWQPGEEKGVVPEHVEVLETNGTDG